MRIFAVTIAGVFVFAALGASDEMTVAIVKVEGKRVTALPTVKKGDKPMETTFFMRHDMKMAKGKFNKDTKKFEVAEFIDVKLADEVLAKGKVLARIVFDANKGISEVRLLTSKKKAP